MAGAVDHSRRAPVVDLEGVGAGRGASLRPGDVVRTEIEQLGVLVNRIVAANPPPHPRTPSRQRLEEP